MILQYPVRNFRCPYCGAKMPTEEYKGWKPWYVRAALRNFSFRMLTVGSCNCVSSVWYCWPYIYWVSEGGNFLGPQCWQALYSLWCLSVRLAEYCPQDLSRIAHRHHCPNCPRCPGRTRSTRLCFPASSWILKSLRRRAKVGTKRRKTHRLD